VELTVTFVGNATTLISAGGITVLTDPNFLHRGQRAYLGYGLVSKRLQDPALSIAQLPPIDAIVLSHMHGDHWDRVAQRDLDHTLPVMTRPQLPQKRLSDGDSRRHWAWPRGRPTPSPREPRLSRPPHCRDGTHRVGRVDCCRP
jgi:L-ascorbate metabolism protein UlaG (beta-lactamase superfamily)